MTWNWQQPDWPRFSWNGADLAQAEQQFLLGSRELFGAVRHLSLDQQNQLAVDAMTEEALTTSEIEGEILSRPSLQSSIRRQLGLSTDSRAVAPAEQGIAEMTVDLYRSYAEPLTDEMLFSWHGMLLAGRRDLVDIGRYRTHEEPMQVVSRVRGSQVPRVHFEAPPLARVKNEMVAFLDWFNCTAPGGTAPLPALTRSGIAHLHFESIHPFEDGNGRIGRAISEKALAQTLGEVTYTAVAATILGKRKAYYDMLEKSSRQNEVTAWLCWFAQIGIDAQRRAMTLIEFLISKSRLLDRLKGQLNARQEAALLRMFQEGPPGFQGGLSAGNYMTITKASPTTATRDLADLVAKGALRQTGELKHTRYHLDLNAPSTPLDR